MAAAETPHAQMEAVAHRERENATLVAATSSLCLYLSRKNCWCTKSLKSQGPLYLAFAFHLKLGIHWSYIQAANYPWLARGSLPNNVSN